mmetsp:Transcript_23180/g.68899  ORF Transcript_23180/g.68899 Transcript_23180/m.68899 type:complete len:111 (-) Transcript_23180:250-582(-)
MRQLADAAGLLRGVVIMVALAGDAVLKLCNMPVPQFFAENVAEKRFVWIIGALFVGNIITNQLTQTHAFEIYANGQVVFSKLEAGRLPSMTEFWTNIEAALGPSSQAVQY